MEGYHFKVPALNLRGVMDETGAPPPSDACCG